MRQQSVQLDPLDSPHPIPWNWVMANLTEISQTGHSEMRYFRSPSLVSPDGGYAAYSRIQMYANPDFINSRVSSVLFLENLKTGDLQVVTADSPLAENPFTASGGTDLRGTIAILIPIGWSAQGDRVLAREFEAIFGSSVASDYAVVWDRHQNQVVTLAPNFVDYTTAVVLGWSQTHDDQVLFSTTSMGEERWYLWTVDKDGQTIAAANDQPTTSGRVVNSIWTGPQAKVNY